MICAACQCEFKPPNGLQRFCSRKCRNNFHNARDGGVYAKVSRRTVLGNNSLSVVLTINAMDREAALSALSGGVVEIVGLGGG